MIPALSFRAHKDGFGWVVWRYYGKTLAWAYLNKNGRVKQGDNWPEVPRGRTTKRKNRR